MNKLVYLFELDSVRKSNQEIRIGQFAMYDELVGNGNIIVMSMNQITDSKSFLCMLNNEEDFQILKKLFKQGRIRISRYGDIRTPSQYVQNAIHKNLAKNEDVFIFSALPVKSSQKKLLHLMLEVLSNADLSAIKEYTGTSRSIEERLALFTEYDGNGNETKPDIDETKAKELLEILYRFLELILTESMYETSANPPIAYTDQFHPILFMDIMEQIVSFEIPSEESERWKRATDCLKQIKNEIRNEPFRNNRSVWITRIKEQEEKAVYTREQLQYAELIVDLCYNYTIEYSIFGSSKHYRIGSLSQSASDKSFQQEFLNRLKYDWENGVPADKRFLQKETNEFSFYDGEYPKWENGIHIISRRKKLRIK